MSQQLEQRLRSLEATLLVNPRDPWTHARRGHVLLQLARFEEATTAFSKVVALDPKLPEGPQGLGEVHLAQGNWPAAQLHFAQALALEKTHVPTLASLIRAHEERAELHHAEQYYAAVLQVKSDDAEWLRRAALNLYRQSKFPLALPVLERAHAKLEKDDEITAGLGTCLAHELHLPEARQLLEPLSARKALATVDETTFANVLTALCDWEAAAQIWARLKSANAVDLETRIGLGRCYEELGRHREAVEELAPIANSAAVADAYWLLGRAHDGLSNAADALRSAEQGLSRFNTDPRLHALAGKALMQLGRVADAVTSLERAVRYAPDMLDAWLLLADGHCRLEQYDGASRAYDRVVEIAPQDASLHLRRADFEREHGTLLRAKDCYTRAFEADKSSSLTALGAADCAAELSDLHEARQWVEKALRIDPGLVAAIRLSGLLHLREGHKSEALKQLREASVLLPKDASVLRAIGQCHRALGDAVHEAETLEKAFALDSDASTAKRLGRVSSELRRYERAVEVLGFVVKETPNDAEAERDLGLAFEQLGQLDAARTALAQACSVDRSDPTSHFALGRVCLGLNDATSAVTALEHANRLGANLGGLEMTMGQAYHRLGLLREAVQVYRRLVAANPKDVLATFELGRALAESSERTDALHYLERVVEQQLNHGEAWLLLGSLRQKSDQPRQALESYRNATVILPDSVEAFRGLAQSAAVVGEHDEAVRAARQWLRLQPDDPTALSQLADSLEDLAQFDEARRIWQQALKQEPESTDFVLRLGLVCVRLNRFDDAAKYLARALAVGVHGVENWEQLADCYERLGSRNDLVATLNKVCDLDPKSGARWRRLGFAELSVGHEPKAITALERGWQEGANDEECRNCIANLHRRQSDRDLLAERFDPALLALEKAIEYLPNDPDLRVNLGQLLRRLNRLDQAYAVFERAISLDPQRADSHVQLAELAELKNDFERAISAYAKLRQLAPDNHTALSGLARMLWRTGKSRDALEVLQRVVELSPDHAEHRLQLGSLLLLEKRPSEAIEHLVFAAESLPLHADAQHTLATCHAQLGQDALSVAAFERALAQQPKQLAWSRQLVLSLQRLGRTREIAAALLPLRNEQSWSAADAATLGLALAKTNRDDEAIDLFREAIAGEPSDDLWLALLDSLWRVGRHQEVIECAESILASNPSHPRALELAAKSILAVGRDESRAIALFERVLGVEPTNAEAQREIVRLRLLRAGESTDTSPEDAIVELRRALELSPNDADVLYRLASCYQHTNQAQLALDQAKKCLAVDEKYASAWVLRGALEAGAGRHSDARVSYERGVAIDPKDPIALAGLARVLESLDDLSAAAGRYQSLCQIEPSVIEWRERVVDLTLELGDKPLVVEHLTALSTLRTLSEKERRQLGFLEAEIGQHDSAIVDLTQVLAVSPSDKGCLFQLSASLTAVGRQEDGIPWLERLVRLDVEYPQALERLGISLSYAGRHAQAIVSLERARSRNTDGALVLESLVQSYATLGDKQHQLEALLALAQLQPNDASHWTTIGQLQIDLNNDAGAIEPWVRAVELGAGSVVRDQLFDLLIEQTDQAMLAGRADLVRQCLASARLHATTSAPRLLACARRLHQVKELSEASDVAQQSRTLVDSLEANLLLGELWLERQRPLEAANSFEQALGLRVDSIAALIGLARAQLAAQAFADAETTLLRASHLAPREASIDELLVQLYEQTSRLQRAVESQRTVVALRSGNVEAHVRLGELQVLTSDHQAAAESFEAAAALAPEQDRVLELLAETYAQLERWVDVLGVVDRAQRRNPGAVNWRERRGNALSQLGRVEDAIVELEAVKLLCPNDARLEEILGGLYARSGQAAVAATDPRQAVQALQKAVAHGDNRVATRQQLAESLRALGNLHEALGWAQSCVRDEPSAMHWLLLGGLEASLGRHDHAATAFESAVSGDARSVAGWEGLGLAFERLGRLDAAIEALQNAVALVPKIAALEALTRLHMGQGDWKRALDSFAQLSRLRPLTSAEHRRVAEAHQHLGQLDDAAAAYEDAIELAPADVGLLTALARLRLDAHRPEDAISATEKAYRLDPESAGIDELLALAYSRTGRHVQAIVAARRQLARAKSELLLQIVADSHEALGQHAEASDALAEIAALSGGSAETLLALGRAQIKSGEKEHAITTLLQAREMSGGQVATLELQPLLLEGARGRIENGRAEQALVMIEQALAVSTTDPSAQFELVKLLMRLKFADRAFSILSIAAPQLKNSAEPSNMAAAICADRQRWREALDWYERANGVQLDDFVSLVGLGRSHLALGRPRDARAPLLTALGQRPTDDGVANLVLEALRGETSVTEQRQCLEVILQLRTSDRIARLQLAELEATAQRHARVAELLEGLDHTCADNSEGSLLLARAYHALGRENDCQRICQSVLRVSPNNAQAMRMLGLSQAQLGDTHGAIAALEASLASASTPEVVRQLYEIYRAEAARAEALGDVEAAITAYARCVALMPQDIATRLTLARLQARVGQSAHAIETLRGGLEKSVEHLEGFTMLGQFYLDAGRAELSVEAFRVARSLSPTSSTIAAYLGIALSIQGKSEEALALLLPLTNEANVSPRVREELAALQRGHGDLAAAAFQLEQLRREQSLSLEQQRELGLYWATTDRQAEARDLLAQLFRADPSDFDVALTYGKVARCMNSLDEALEALRGATRLRPDRADVAQLFGEALLSQGNSREAHAALERALNLGRNTPEIQEVIAASALQVGDRPRWVQALRARSLLLPEVAAVHADLAEALAATGSYGEAQVVFRRALSIEKNPLWFRALADCCAALSDQPGRLEALNGVCELRPGDARALAESGLARYAAGHSHAAVDALGQALRLDPTIEEAKLPYATAARQLAQEHLRKQETRAALELYQNITRYLTPTLEILLEYASCHSRLGQLEQATTLLQKALEVAPGDESASLLLASLLVRQNRRADAIRIYETALQHHRTSVVVARALSMQYEEQGQYDLAARALGQAYAPADVDADFVLAYMAALTSSGRAGDAISVGREGLERFPTSAELLHRVAALYAGQGWHPQSAELLGRAVTIDPPHPSRYYLFVRELLELGHDADAGQWLEAGLKRFPNDASLVSLLLSLGGRTDATKDFRRSAQIYQRALEADPSNLAAFQGLGNAFVMLGQNAQALLVFEKAVAVIPNDAQLRFSLGSMYAMQRRLADATQHWEVLRTLNPEMAVRLAQLLGT